MSRIIERLAAHGFIIATSVAMFVHSTWTFNTLFAGQQPTIDGSLSQWISYLLWVIPGALIALAIDIGQIQTSGKIIHERRRAQRLALIVTFGMLALAGYYLQWFHLVHHMPALDFGQGLTEATRASVTGWRDLAIFIVPALLPLSTILYTVSNIQPQAEQAATVNPTSHRRNSARGPADHDHARESDTALSATGGFLPEHTPTENTVARSANGKPGDGNTRKNSARA
jgi:uncharacterized membrane protein YidH (DUF202 family)